MTHPAAGRMLTLATLVLLQAGLSASLSAAEPRPNVIIVMTDDQGYGELSCHGNPVLRTPRLDELAQESVRFGDFHVSPMCAPTRGQLLTGLDAARNGCVNVSSGRALLRKDLPTMADHFRENGYATGVFGKWHLGDNYPYRPEDRGFDEAVWFPSSHISSVPDFWGNDYFDDTYVHNGEREAFEGYCTDVFFEQAMRFIGSAVGEGKPFFAYLPTNTPHWPFFAKDEDVAAIKELYARSPIADRDIERPEDLVKYLAMIRNIDWNVGRLRDFLSAKELARDTVFIFLTDNGSIMSTRYYDAGMRGMKTQLWEGGHRVPLFVHYPEGSFRKRVVHGLAQVQDILPTLVDLCDLRVPEETRWDGISLRPFLEGNADIPDDRMLVINYSRMPMGFEYPSPFGQSIVKRDKSVVLWKRWRLVENRELYDLDSDPMQTTNVITRFSDVARTLGAHLETWWDGVEEGANEPQRVVIGNDRENPMRLTACEWLDVFIDQQGQVRRGESKNGYWLLDVERAGTYEFELRRWPRELDLALSDIEDGVEAQRIPLRYARLYIDGVVHQEEYQPYGYEGETVELEPEDKSARFQVDLKAGPIALHTWFDKERPHDQAFGAYYVYVTRLGE